MWLKYPFKYHNFLGLEKKIIKNLNPIKNLARRWRGGLSTLFWVMLIIMGLRLSGWLQPIEWTGLDLFFQLRPIEAVDNRIVIVGITESDIQKLDHYPMTDFVLASLLEKIKEQQPRAIGLDVYRDRPVLPEDNDGYKKLVNIFETTPNLVGAEKILSSASSPPVSPPPTLAKQGQVGAIDIILDGDRVVRRSMLYPDPINRSDTPSLGLFLAYLYLQEEGIDFSSGQNGSLQIKNTLFTPFETNDGGYVKTDAGGYQMFLNYRNPPNTFPIISVFDVLEGRVKPELIQNKIVLIGAVAPSLNDIFYTPYSHTLLTTPTSVYGVELHANVVSQILSSVLDNRPLIKVWTEEKEILWIASWIGIATILIWETGLKNSSEFFYWRALAKISILALLVSAIAYWFFVVSALWIPVVPPLLGISLTLFFGTRAVYVEQLRQANANLEAKVKQRTKELAGKTKKLEAIANELMWRKKQLAAQEKLQSLSLVLKRMATKIGNPINQMKNYALVSRNLAIEVKLESQKILQDRTINLAEKNKRLNEIWYSLFLNLETIKLQGDKASLIVDSILVHALPENQNTTNLVLANINEIIANAIRGIESNQITTTKERDLPIKINTVYDESIQEFFIDAQDVFRVATNLINNALEAVQARQIKLNSPCYQPEVRVYTQEREEIIEIIIEDNGEGIPQKNLNQIYLPFFTTKPAENHAGLGLFIAYNIIVNKNRGKIRVKSQINQGTAFTVLWPKT